MKINELPLPAHIKLHAFDSREALTDALASRVSDQLNQRITAGHRGSLAVSGGSTPLPLFKQLSQTELRWSEVDITLADERWVAPTDDSSNEKLVRDNLLQHNAVAANFIGLWSDDATPQAGLGTCEAALAQLNTALDVLILGMGNDGHTASLFPCSAELEAAVASEKDCAAIQPTSAPHSRMTLTPKRLLNSELRILHLCGEDKLATLQAALADSDYRSMPIRLFMQQPLEIYWAP